MIIGIIPARYGSSRFPGKPLIDIQGKSMIRRVYEQAMLAKKLDTVVVATDDVRIYDHVKAFSGQVVMTHSDHPSGTDRCWEAYAPLDARNEMRDVSNEMRDVSEERSDTEKGVPHISHHTSQISHPTSHYILNIQGDEPFVVPEQIDELAGILDGHVELATQMIAVESAAMLWDMGEVKIVLNDRQEAIYFSRQAIPFLKNVDPQEWHQHHAFYRHVGMYAYRADILQQLTQLPPSPLEKAESLEQLRWLEAGYKIKCVTTSYESHCIDTPEDLLRLGL